ncbi:MAG: universal stress protein [Limisphaerales bacterium]
MPLLLACTDGSAYAPGLYQHTAWAAGRMGASVEVLHVLDPHRERAAGVDLSGSIGFDASAQLTEELTRLAETQARVQRLKGRAILEDAKAKLSAAGVTGITTTQRHGTLVERLTELEPGCDLVIIGKRGEQAGFDSGHLGGHLERVVRTAVRPVLVTAQTFQPIERFLIAYDGGPSVTRAIDFVLASPLLQGLDVHLLRAGQVDDNARWYLEEAAARLRQGGYRVASHAVAGAPESVIADVIQRERIQLLVMGAYGHSPIRAFILGSTTTNMVRTSPVSVLMFR